MKLQQLIKDIEKKQLKIIVAPIKKKKETKAEKKKRKIDSIAIKTDDIVIEKNESTRTIPLIKIGDTVKVGLIIQEGNKQRTQPYEGIIIAQHRAGLSTTITVRRISQNIGVERIFPVHSPLIQNIEIIRQAKVRKAKLYYLRTRVGKSTRLKERFN